MPYYTKYHIREQEAYALLAPIVAGLRELEARTEHYVKRVHLDGVDQATIDAAHQAISGARAEVERLWTESRKQGSPASTQKGGE